MFNLHQDDAVAAFRFAGELLAGEQPARGVIPVDAPSDVRIVRTAQPEILAGLGANFASQRG